MPNSPEFKLKPSLRYLTIILMVFLLSLIIAMTLPLKLISRSFLVLGVSVYVISIVWRYVLLRGNQAVISLQRLPQGLWQLRTKNHILQANLCQDSTVTRMISILRFRHPQKYWPITCIVFPDSIAFPGHASRLYKHLLVVIRMG